MAVNWTQLRPHIKQSQLWRSTHKNKVVYAGRRSGKTELAKRFTVRHLNVRKRGRVAKYLYGMPTHNQVKRIAWYDLLKFIPKYWIKDISLSEMRIQTIYNTELYVLGLDVAARAEGSYWDGVILDERSDIKPGTYTRTLRPCLAEVGGWCWQIGVPKRYGEGAEEFKEYCFSSNFEVYNWHSNTVMTKEQLDDERALMTEEDFEEQFGATWQTIGGLVFYAFDKSVNVREVVYDPSLPIGVCSDFNVNPMCWCLTHSIDGEEKVFDEIFLRNANTPATLDHLYSKYPFHSAGWEFYGDASARARKTSAYFTDLAHIENDDRFDEYIPKKMFYQNHNPSHIDRFSSCNAMFRNGLGVSRIQIDPRCERLIKDLDSRAYKEESRELADSGDMGHMSDALGYKLHMKYPIGITINQGVQRVGSIAPKVMSYN